MVLTFLGICVGTRLLITDSVRTARYGSVKVGRRHRHRIEIPLEILRAWGNTTHVVKGICERQIAHSSLETEICLVGVKQIMLLIAIIMLTYHLLWSFLVLAYLLVNISCYLLQLSLVLQTGN
jgi:CTP synthase (UTP-ammonia lyase)